MWGKENIQLNSEDSEVFEKSPVGNISSGTPVWPKACWYHAMEASCQLKSSQSQTSSQVVQQIACKYNFSVLQFQTDFQYFFSPM